MSRDRSAHLSPTQGGKSAPGLSALLAFDSVARHLNFARAAAELDVTPTAMSKIVKTLEAQLGVRLFNRTTRSVGLTEHGAQLLGSLAPALEQIRRSVQQVGETAARPRGLLRINTSHVAFVSLIQAHQADFLRQFPDIALEVVIDNQMVDIVAGGFDAGIRLGHAVQRDMVAVPLGAAQRTVVVAAPDYLARHGAPAAPEDVLEHACIRQRFGAMGRYFEWRFEQDGQRVAIEPPTRLVHTEMRCVLDAARQGLGLAFVYRQFADEYLRSGQLVPLLQTCCAPAEAFYLYYPHRVQMPGKLRAFIDFMQDRNRPASA
ncbi:LysR family transcriptional regulator [Methyloversatilis universalis]|uniref:LysR family transcriptional regulator n=1 Tax=Methyloversatilis universalis TaxID=378211 RepID=UPI00036C8501|nr:LysR family transcriptional regulator [Methyloversatilis universalis]